MKRLGLSGALERTLSTTNPVENLIGQARATSKRVKRWRGGSMILRWCAAGVLDAESRFHRVKGKDDVPRLIAALRRHDAEVDAMAVLDSAVCRRSWTRRARETSPGALSTMLWWGQRRRTPEPRS